MSGLNEIGGPLVNAVTNTAPPRTERSEMPKSPEQSVAIQQAQGTQPDEIAAKEAGAKAIADASHPEAVAEAVKAINAQVQRVSQTLKFAIDHDSGRVVVKVVDGETDKVIRQIPSEEALAISQSLEKAQGLIIKQKA